MKKTYLCAIILTIAIITAFSFHWATPAALAVLIAALIDLIIIIPEIRRTPHEIKGNTD